MPLINGAFLTITSIYLYEDLYFYQFHVKKILDYVEEKWPGNGKMILKKMTQKCMDLYNNRKDLRIIN